MSTHQCGRIRYPSGPAARRHLQKIRRNGARAPEWGIPTRAYACPHCGGWHLTAQGVGDDEFAIAKQRRKTASRPERRKPRGWDL